MAVENEIRWGLAQRLEFIEWRAYWVGRINRKNLEDQFGISTPQASADFGRYQSAAPGNIEYDSAEKTYVVSDDFRPRFLKLSPTRYLRQLHAICSDAIQKSDTWFDNIPAAQVTPPMVRGPEAYVLRSLLRAMELRQAIEVNYRSLSRVGVRKICPHALAYDGHRWHVRALSLDHKEFRDYVLGRILTVSDKVEECGTEPADDVEWNTEVTLRLIAHPDLDDEQRKTIEHDFHCKDNELHLPIRLALAFYFIKRNNLDLRKGEIPPERAQLFLKNLDDIDAALADAKNRSKALVAARLGTPVED